MPKRVTLADVAERAGVSKTAVSLILNNRPGTRLSADAAQRVRAAARELSYRPNPAARSLRMGKTRTVGFISNDVAITRYASAMIRGALDVADFYDHTVLIAEIGSSGERMSAALEAMVDRQADAIIFGSMAAHLIDVPAVPSDVPVVLLNAASTKSHATVLPAEHQAGYEVTQHLIDHGHRRIGLIGNSRRLRTRRRLSATIGQRFAGIHQALADAGLELTATIDEDAWEPDRGYQATQRLLDGEPITALITLNDRLAFGAYQAAGEQGLRIPDDISIASFDDDVIAGYLRPGLTTARIPFEQMGRQAMEIVLGVPGGRQHRLVSMPLQIRSSVRRI